VQNEVDLVLQQIAGQKNYNEDDFKAAEVKFHKELIKYSGDACISKHSKK